MAFSFTHRSASGAQVYNTDYQVGVTGANFKPDVMLVQALLNLLYFTNDGELFLLDYSVYSFERPSGAEPLVIDGICGPLTKQLVKSYQQRLQTLAPKLTADGHLDPVLWPGKGSILRGRGLGGLGNTARISDEVHGTKHYERIALDAEYPAALRNALAYRKDQARFYAKATHR